METRETYGTDGVARRGHRPTGNTAMQPGRELDALVARTMGLPNIYMDYSTRIEPAMEAWAWLEGNHPWRDADLMLTRYSLTGENAIPSVLVMVTFWDTSIRPVWNMQQGMNFYIPGSDYPHAIALAVVEAGKALGLMVDAPPEM